MPILDSVKKHFRKKKLPVSFQKAFSDRLVHNFPPLQLGFKNLTGNGNEEALLELIYTLIEKSIEYRGSRKSRKERLIGFRSNGKSIGKDTRKYIDQLIDNGFTICSLDASLQSPDCSVYHFSERPVEPILMVRQVFSGEPNIFINFQIYQDNFHEQAEFIFACKEIIDPAIKIIVNPIPGTGNRYYSDKSWFHYREGDIVVSELFPAACWDAIATRHTIILKSSLEKIMRLESKSVLCIDPGYIAFCLDDEDIYFAGYTPEPHRKFLKDFYTYNFPGTMSSMSLVFKDGIDVFQGDIAMLSGFKKATDMKDRIWRELSFLRIRLLETLMFMLPGVPVVSDTPSYPFLNSQLWKFRQKVLAILATEVNQAEIIHYEDTQVLGLAVSSGRRKLRCWFNFVPENRDIYDDRSIARLRKRSRKDLLGQNISLRKDRMIIEPYGLIII